MLRWLWSRRIITDSRSAIRLEGFGFLVPRGQKVRTLGTVWNSSLFPGRAREGTVTMTSFIGGATDVDIVQHSEEEIARIVQDENAHILGITGPPIETAVWGYPRALPQYNLGHGHIVEAIRDAERDNPGLFFAGNYLEGPAIGKCVENGFHTAEAVTNICKRVEPPALPSAYLSDSGSLCRMLNRTRRRSPASR